MQENYLLKTSGARQLYREFAQALPIIDFHNHISVEDIAQDRTFENLTQLWLTPDPYKHRLMRICGIDECFITGNAEPFEKFQKYCEVFPYLAGNPVYDWSRMELDRVFGITEMPCRETARRIYDRAGELLRSREFSNNEILKRFNIEYQSPVANLMDDLSGFDAGAVAPSLRGDDLLDKDMDTAQLRKRLDAFAQKGCRFADHALDADFFKSDTDGSKTARLCRLGAEYAERGWTLLLHMDAKRQTSQRLRTLAGPAGGYAAVGGGFPIAKVCDLLGTMEAGGGLPDTVLFPLNMSDQAPLAVLQGSFSQDGIASKVQLGPAWWWCDHPMGIRNTLECIASFGVLSQFIGMTTDSRSILSFVRHDYFRRLLCTWLDEQNTAQQWALPEEILGQTVKKICYQNAMDKIRR